MAFSWHLEAVVFLGQRGKSCSYGESYHEFRAKKHQQVCIKMESMRK